MNEATAAKEASEKELFRAYLAELLVQKFVAPSLDTFSEIVAEALSDWLQWQGEEWVGKDRSVGIDRGGYAYAVLDTDSPMWAQDVFHDLPQPVQDAVEKEALNKINNV